MACNIYDEPKFGPSARYSARPTRGSEEREEHEEREVDIYESAEFSGSKAPPRPLPRPRPDPDRFKLVSAALGVICLILLITIGFITNYYVLKKEPPPGLCPDGWQRFRCSCFLVSLERKNWTESRGDCETRDARLVVIDDREEQGFVRALRQDEELWIGLSYSEGWAWVNEAPMSVSSWLSGVNTVNVKSGSAAFMTGTEAGHWNHTVDGLRCWVCEKEI